MQICMLQAKLSNAQQVVFPMYCITVKKFQVDALAVQSNLLLQQILLKFVF